MKATDLTIGTTFESHGAVLKVVEIPECPYKNKIRIICEVISRDKNSDWYVSEGLHTIDISTMIPIDHPSVFQNIQIK